MARIDWFRKLPDTVRSASGLEWTLWRKLPLIFVTGTLLLLAVAVALHWTTDQSNAAALRRLQTMDYVLMGMLAFFWSTVVTVAIGCVVVMLMKGPGYVADGLEVTHSDQPRRVAEGQEPPP
jgi:hypothetical protein